MKKEELKSNLSIKYRGFTDFINSLAKQEFEWSKKEKWTPGQQLEHIYLSIRPLEKILRSLEVLVQANFGKSNGVSKDYDTIVKNYQAVLATGAKATAPFEPKKVLFEDRPALTKKLVVTIDTLCNNIEKLSEQELDEYYIPHPILKKLTIREMMYFTIYHLEHHYKKVKENL